MCCDMMIVMKVIHELGTGCDVSDVFRMLDWADVNPRCW